MTCARIGFSCLLLLATTAACERGCSDVTPDSEIARAVAPDSATLDAVANPAETYCPEFLPGRRVGRASFVDLTEASGLAASRQHPGVLWVHNDSGNEPVLYAMSDQGKAIARFDCLGTVCVDWEDLAVGPGEENGQWYLYISDSGNNNTDRSEIILYRVNEPDLESTDTAAAKAELDGFTEFRLRYADGLPHDAETLFVDPLSGNLYLVTKDHAGQSLVFEATAPLEAHGQTLEQVATLRFPGRGGSERATAGDISPDGRMIVIKTYTNAYAWLREGQEPIRETFARKPCPAPLAREPQGESLGFSASGQGYFTLSEGRHQPLYLFELEPAR